MFLTSQRETMKKPKFHRDFKRPHGEYLIVKEGDLYVKKKIEKRDKRTFWELMKEFINVKIKTGSIFTRSTMISYMYPNIGKLMQHHTNVVDSYKALLIHPNVNIIEKTTIRGQYRKVRDIPNDISITTLKKIYSDNSWMNWFSGTTLEQKMEAYESEKVSTQGS